MLVQLAIQLLLPIGLVVLMARSQPRSRLKWLTDTLALSLILLFIVLIARWDLTSYYLRLIVIPSLWVASWFAYRRIERSTVDSSPLERLRHNAGNVLLIALMVGLNVVVLRGFSYKGEAVDLAYPLRDGTYYVGGGGTSRWINNHSAFPPQDFALDILELTSLGNRAAIGGASDLDKHQIFGAGIYSPCSGTIVAAVDGLADQVPPNRDTANLAGNHVVVLCHDVEVVLAHLRQGSVLVATGNTVSVGQEIGAVGNSGNSSQPHLHLHAEQGGQPGQILDGEGVPVTFNGRFLVRNDIFTGDE